MKLPGDKNKKFNQIRNLKNLIIKNMEFEITKDRPAIIKVIGVGGGGSNAVNHMYRQGIKGVDFMVCNTDAQALEISPIPFKVQLGPSLTEGRGAGSLPEVGKNSAIENIEDIKKALSKDTKMVFITAGMGGGTGTGAAPIIAGVAKEMGILTVGIVTVPFAFEGKKRKSQANFGIDELKRNVDTLLVICNDKLREIHGDLKLTDAFGRADDILTIAAKSIAEIITVTGYINVDFADVQTVLKDSGGAIMGSAHAEGENRAMDAAKLALDSPLLNDSEITGARYILLNINSGSKEVTMDEIGEITDYIQDQAGSSADIIMGTGQDETLGEKISVTIIATGFKTATEITVEQNKPMKVVLSLNDNVENVQTKATTMAEPVLISNTPVIEPATAKNDQDFLRATLANRIEEINEPAAFEDAHYSITDSENTINYEFDLTTSVEHTSTVISEETSVNEMELKSTIETSVSTFTSTTSEVLKTNETADANDDQFKKTRDRIMKLRELSYKHSSLGSKPITDLENEPAYKRKNIQLANVPASDVSVVSRFSIGLNENKGVEIKTNNPFLNDRVD